MTILNEIPKGKTKFFQINLNLRGIDDCLKFCGQNHDDVARRKKIVEIGLWRVVFHFFIVHILTFAVGYDVIFLFWLFLCLGCLLPASC